MQQRESIDHSFADTPSQIKILADLTGYLATDNQTSSSFHQVERHANYRRVFAKQIRLRRKWKQGMHGPEHPVFSRHIVSGRRDRTKGRPPQDKFVIVESDQVSEIGVPARELFNLNARRLKRLTREQLRQVFTQVRFESLKIELFTGSDWRGIVVLWGYIGVH